MPVRQHALTVVAPVRKELRETLAKRLDDAESDVRDALVAVRTLHFARFVLIDGPDGKMSRLAFESNHDGDLDLHVESLARALAPFEELLFGSWEGYRLGDLAGFVAKHSLPASTYYLGHPGLSVEQILNDDKVRRAAEELLDADDGARGTGSETATALRDRLVAAIAKTDLVVGPVDRGLPAQPLSTIKFWAGVAFNVVPRAAVLVPAAMVVEARERREEPPRELITEEDERLDPINRREDATTQNGLTHHVALRKGWLRKTTLKAVLAFLESARQNVAYSGTLGGISSIHFARWVLLDDDTVLFFSNYDGSWEAYLGDFVDKAHLYLSGVWSNTKWFPDTQALIFKGASKEIDFKRWTRTCQVENRIWYSAYKKLTVWDVLRNERIRVGAAGPMNETEAQAWLALL